jgi:hypothetical protein
VFLPSFVKIFITVLLLVLVYAWLTAYFAYRSTKE